MQFEISYMSVAQTSEKSYNVKFITRSRLLRYQIFHYAGIMAKIIHDSDIYCNIYWNLEKKNNNAICQIEIKKKLNYFIVIYGVIKAMSVGNAL